MGGFVYDMVFSSGHWISQAILSHVGWPGIVAAIAAVVLVLSACPKALKFLSSPRGMVLSVTVLVAALTFIGWQFASPATPNGETVASADPPEEQPEPIQAAAAAPEPELETALESVTVLAPATPSRDTQAVPPLPMIGPANEFTSPIFVPPPGMLHLPPTIIANPMKGKPRGAAGKPSGDTGKSASSHPETSEVANGRAGHGEGAKSGTSKPFQTASKLGGPKLAAKSPGGKGNPLAGGTGFGGQPGKPSTNGADNGQRPLTAAEINAMRKQEEHWIAQERWMQQAEMERVWLQEEHERKVLLERRGMPPTQGTGHTGGTQHPNGRPR